MKRLRARRHGRKAGSIFSFLGNLLGLGGGGGGRRHRLHGHGGMTCKKCGGMYAGRRCMGCRGGMYAGKRRRHRRGKKGGMYAGSIMNS